MNVYDLEQVKEMPDQVRQDICKPGCYGPACEGPLEGVAEDPLRVG